MGTAGTLPIGRFVQCDRQLLSRPVIHQRQGERPTLGHFCRSPATWWTADLIKCRRLAIAPPISWA